MNKLERYFYFALLALFIGLWAKECKRKDCPETVSADTKTSVPGYVPIPVDTLETDEGINYTFNKTRVKQPKSTSRRNRTPVAATTTAVSDYAAVGAVNIGPDTLGPPVNPPRPPGRGYRPRPKIYRDTCKLFGNLNALEGRFIMTDTVEGVILGRSYSYELYKSSTPEKKKALLYAGPEIYSDFNPAIVGAGVGMLRISKNRGMALSAGFVLPVSVGLGLPVSSERRPFGRVGLYIKL